jgi:hypothetical protein
MTRNVASGMLCESENRAAVSKEVFFKAIMFLILSFNGVCPIQLPGFG